mgnify:CR=1 FL=1
MAKTLREKKINQIMYICAGGAIVAIILFIILFNMLNGSKNNSDRNMAGTIIEQANTSVGKTVEEAQKSEQENNSDVQVKITENTNEQDEVELEDEKDTTAKTTNSTDLENSEDVQNSTNEINSANVDATEDSVDPTFTMPVEGEVSKHYGREKLIYSDTLKEWTTHLGIDIKADKTTVVKSSADGTVKSIKNDPRYGLTVVIEHTNGFTSIYSNLLTAEFVVVGETVKAGQTIGTVGNTATFEILDDAHLHFEIQKDGNSIDPEMYIK